MKTIVRILSRITFLAAAGILLGLLYKADANAVTLNVSVDPEASGSVSVNGADPNTLYNIDVDPGVPVTLDATQANGYVFSQWNINVPELVNGDQYSSSISFIMPNEGVEAIAHFQPAPAPDPSQPAESSADPPKSEEPPRDEIEEIMEQTSDSVGNVASTVNQINLATDLAGFAVSTPKTDLIKDYLLKDDEDILVKVSNFDAKKSPD